MKGSTIAGWRGSVMLASACMVAVLLAASSGRAQIPHYTNGMTGTFGSAGNWTFNAPGITINSTDDEYAVRFTSYENITVDRAWQRFVSIDAGTTVEVGIMADNGSGLPSGVYLSSGTLSFGAGMTVVTNVNFSASVALTNGGVYHLVSRATAIVGDFDIYRGGTEVVRPFDRAVDPNMQHVLRRFNGGAWGTLATNPYFALGNSGGVVGGPGQPYANTVGNQFTTTGGSGTASGQRFTITDKEIPEGASVAVNEIRMAATAVGSPTSGLILRLRETNGTILASATVPVSLADGVVRTHALDGQVELREGVPYLLTTEFAGASISSHLYRFTGLNASEGPGLGNASWGGTNISFAILSGAANNWSTFTQNASRLHTDMVFTFQGVVVPEPSIAALMAVGAVALIRRRRSA